MLNAQNTATLQNFNVKYQNAVRQKRNLGWVCAEVSIEDVFKISNFKTEGIDAGGWLKGEEERLWRRQKHSLSFEEKKEKNRVNENAQQKTGHLNASTYGSSYLVICGHYKASICVRCKFLIGGASLVNGRVFTANYSSQKLSCVVQSLLFMEAHKL